MAALGQLVGLGRESRDGDTPIGRRGKSATVTFCARPMGRRAKGEWVYKALAPGVIREGAEMDSDKAGKLEEGEEIVVTERKELDDGTMRVKFDRGWTSVSAKSGKALLELVEEEQTFTPVAALDIDIEAVFRVFDTDGTGTIDVEELKVGMRSVGLEPNQEEIRNLMFDIDVDGSGTIDVEEYRSHIVVSNLWSVLGQAKEARSTAFRSFDDDQTGTISFKNLKRVAHERGVTADDEGLQEMVDAADQDGDGEINEEEFGRIMDRVTSDQSWLSLSIAISAAQRSEATSAGPSRSGEPKQRRKRGDEDLLAAGTWVAIAGYGKAEVLRFHKGRYRVRFEDEAERNMYHHEIKGQETEASE